MQDRDFSWFVEHYHSLYEQYGHKYLAIKDAKVIGSYDNFMDGILNTAEHEPLGSFIVQECNGDESAYSAYITTPGIIM